MGLEFIPIYPVSILAICIMIGTLVVAYYKKWMMTYALIIANFIVFVITIIFPITIYNLGFSPSFLSMENIPQLYTIFTSMFIHGGFLHLFMNMFIFFFIGMAFEQRIGWKNFLIIYLLAGVCGTLTYSLVNLGSATVMIGASGAIFGIMGAFAFSYPHDRIIMPLPFIGLWWTFITRQGIKVIYAVILFAAIETFYVFLGVVDQTAHFAHIGGLIGGAVLAAILIRGGKTHTKEGKTLYYDSLGIQKERKIDFTALRKLANTPELKDILKKIENETIPHARAIWLEHFLEKVKCPKCGNPLHQLDKKILCQSCDFKTNY